MKTTQPALIDLALRAICLTRDHFGASAMPASPGWEWFDAGKKLAASAPECEWSKQFWTRIRGERGFDRIGQSVEIEDTGSGIIADHAGGIAEVILESGESLSIPVVEIRSNN